MRNVTITIALVLHGGLLSMLDKLGKYERRWKLVDLLNLCCLLIGISTTVFRGWFSRYGADDFCMSAGANISNLVTFVRTNYLTWSGRFSYFISVWFSTKLGPRAQGFILSFVIIFWLLILNLLLKQLNARLNLQQTKLHLLLLSLIIIFVIIETAPSKHQSFLWRDGFINHTLPLVFITFLACFFFYVNTMKWIPSIFIYISFFFSVLFAGGFSETSSLSILVFFSLANIVYLLDTRVFLSKKEHKILILGLVASLAAFLIEYISPGNSVRQSSIGMEAITFQEVIYYSIRNAIIIFVKYLVHNPLLALVTFGSGFLLFDKKKPVKLSLITTSQHFLIVFGILAGLLFSIVLPVVLFMHAYPDDRIVILPNYYITIALLFTGFLFHQGLFTIMEHKESFWWTNSRRILTVSITLMIAIATMLTFRQLTLDVTGLREYTIRWDAREQILLQEKMNGSSEIVVPGLPAQELVADIRVDPNYWVNACMAAYYRVDKIIGK